MLSYKIKFKYMFRNICAFLLLSTSAVVFSQKVQVTEATEKVGDVLRTGMSINLQLNEKMVDNGWEKFLKEHGKYADHKNEYTQEVGEYKDLSGTPVRVYAKVSSNKSGSVTIFWALDLGSEYITTKNAKYSVAEKMLHDFGVSMYIQDVNEQVKDAESALEDATKKHEKKIRESENLVKKVDNNKTDKIKLEQKIKDNAQELVDLQKAQEQNKLDQADAVKDVDKMKKAVEVTKQKLKGIE